MHKNISVLDIGESLINQCSEAVGVKVSHNPGLIPAMLEFHTIPQGTNRRDLYGR